MSLLSSKRERKKNSEPISPVNKHPGGRRGVGARTLFSQTLKSFLRVWPLATLDGILVANDSHFSYVMGLKQKLEASLLIQPASI